MEKPLPEVRPVRLAERLQSSVAWAILAAGTVLSLALGFALHRQLEQETRFRFESDARELLYRVQEEIGAYEEVLVGLRAFIGSKETVSRAEFRRYVEGLDIGRRFPGFDSLNYAQVVHKDQLARFVEGVRRDRSVSAEGFPAFSVSPPGERDEYHVIVFVEPFAKFGSSFGRDVAARASGTRAWAYLRDTGNISTSGRLVQIPGAEKRLAMRLAVYKPGSRTDSEEARRAAFIGSVGAGYRIADLLRGAVPPQQLHDMRLRLFDLGMGERASDPADDRVLFDSEELAGPGQRTRGELERALQFRQNFPVGGRVWQVEFSAPMRRLGPIGSALPWLTIAGGILVSLLLSGLFRSYATSRRRAEAIARAMTRDLAESEASLAAAQQIAKLGNWSMEMDGGRMRWSAVALKLLDVDRAPGNLEEYLALVHPDDRELVRQSIANCRLQSTPFDLEHRARVRAGERWFHTLGETRADQDGRISVISGTIMDISERKLIARRKDFEGILAKTFASARPTPEAMAEVLQAICAECAFAAGRFWESHEDGARQSAQWGPLPPLPALEQAEAAMLGGAQNWLTQALHSGGSRELGALDALFLPLIGEEKRLGGLALFSPAAHVRSPEDLKLVEEVVSQVGQYLLRRRVEDNFKHLATHDVLTGLPNRLLFGERVFDAIARSESSQRGLAVLLVDLDRFKNVNDTLGHGAGDAVLKACAERLSRCLRDNDLVARVSGDEFAVLIEPCTQPAAAIGVARKVLAALERPLIVQGQEIVLTGSVGISLYHEDGRDAETLLKHADIAMFKAKESGRNCYQFYSAQMNSHSLQRLGLEAALRRALEREEFLLHYQPKFELATGAITGVEALIRWQNPELGLVPPAQFIPIAEETGLIEPIGAWVLKEACAQARRWAEQGIEGIRVAVNLSARQFRNEFLCRDIRKCLSESGMDPRLLELELTESMVMQDPELATTMLKDLKRMGLRLSIDDFGTGYSSLAYLKRFPIDSVKIDRSFVKDIPGDGEDMAIVEAVIALAQSLRLSVVAEGVETAEQKEHLKRLGCDEMQGYFASKPLPAAEATRFLEAHVLKENRTRGRASLQIVS